MAKTLPCGVDGNGKLIRALVDDEDWDRLAKYNWLADYRYASGSKTDQISRVRTRYNLYLHYAVLEMTPDGKLVIDHIDRNPLNNQKSNLRLVTQRVNNRNRENYKGGIYRDKGRWTARMRFKTKERAIAASKLLEEYRLSLEGEE